MISAKQLEIIQAMHTIPQVDAEGETRKRVQLLKSYLMQSGRKKYVLGISGGQDSTLAGKLAQMAISDLREETGDTEYSFIALLLPYREQKDIADARCATEFIQADQVITLNIAGMVDAFETDFNESVTTELPDMLGDFNKGNVKARARMIAQYAYAGQYGGLVIGTDHAAENVTGFFTMFGDGACDVMPLFGLNKRQGKQLLAHLSAPRRLYEKLPTADLLDERPGQTDEMELGMSYQVIDDYLEGKIVPDADARKIEARYDATSFKRVPTPNLYNQ